MNIDAINNLAAFLDNIPSRHGRGFNMNSYMGSLDTDDVNTSNVGFQCNSTACIAGWACLVLGKKGDIRKTERRTGEISEMYETFAADLLDLDLNTAHKLFEPMNTTHINEDWDKVTPRQAAKVLRHLAKTGEVDWSIALTS